jgi:lipoate---protein ligase
MMEPELNLIKMEGVPIFQQLEVEEALLRVGKGNFCLLNHGSPPAIVLGLSSSVEDHVFEDRVRERPIPLIRRFSGGGTVVIDENTIFFTLILNKGASPFEVTTSSFLQWTSGVFSPLFGEAKFSIEGRDYVVDGKKVGGNAQSLTKSRALHHTSLLWLWESENMKYLKMPSLQPEYRKGRDHEDFCGTLSPYFLSKDVFLESIEKRLSDFFSITQKSFQMAREACFLPHTKRLEYIFI